MSSTKQDWTPEPWHFRTREMDGIGCYSNDIRIYQGTREGGSSEWVADCGCETDPIRHKNARRIVACVNALAGIPDPAAYLKEQADYIERLEAELTQAREDARVLAAWHQRRNAESVMWICSLDETAALERNKP